MRPLPSLLNDASAILKAATARLRHAPLAVLVALALAQLAAATVLAPLGAGALDWLVSHSGRYAVANEDLVGFVLSPIGLATLLVGAVVSLTGTGLGRAAALLAAHRAAVEGRASGIVAFVGAVRRLGAIVELSLRQVVILGLLAAPFVAVIGGIAVLVLRDVDLYWLVTTRPLRYWVGVGCVAPVALVGAVVVLRRVLAWSIALPYCVLGRRAPGAAMRESTDLLRGRIGTVAVARIGWLVVSAVAGMVILAVVYMAAKLALRHELGGLKLTAIAAGLALLVHASIAALAALVATAGDVLVVFAVWLRVASGVETGSVREPIDRADSSTRRLRLVVVLGLAGAAVAATLVARGLVESIDRPLHVELTAHRGASTAAPENTIAAIRAAIELGADRVEVDVMRSGDGAVVLMHDTDLRRLANDPRRIADMTLAQLRTVDVGAWFGEAFAGERIPTLDEALDASAGEAPLNIELKVAGDEAALADAVAAIVRAHGADGGRGDGPPDGRRAIVTSLSMQALEATRRADPSIPIGLIVTVSIGDLRRLDVDLLSVDVRQATPDFLARAAAANLPVHVWSVKDPDLLTQLVLRGVDGVITSDVAPMRARLDELAKLDDAERLMLAFRARLLE
ncbi:MAG: glycerophosphodiester phosphodiesterase family protein [Phycisphaerales bacterium]